MALIFFAPGSPITQGSARAFVVRGKGGPPRAVITHANPKLREWRGVVAVAARAAGAQSHARHVAVRVTLTFFLRRPAGHFGTGKNAGVVKASAPRRPIGEHGGDVDKLARGVLDALTGVCWETDAQVADMSVVKEYAATVAGVRVEIEACE